LECVLLLSGGLDSVVNLKRAVDDGRVVLAITFDYGQTAFENEKTAAASCAARYRIPHRVIDLRWYHTLAKSPLLGDGPIPSYEGGLPSDRDRLLGEAWVPNRNAVFVAIGAAAAEAAGAGTVVIGLNREEAEVFPDNSQDFLDSVNSLLRVSTLSGVEAVSYTADLTKRDIVKMGLRIGAPLDLVYSCYGSSPDQRMCGRCQSCIRLIAALKETGLADDMAGRFQA
jgi:7-cyano-7-deazaguanine synthase